MYFFYKNYQALKKEVVAQKDTAISFLILLSGKIAKEKE